MAEAEHDGWMEQKYRDGWVHGMQRNDKEKIHNLLIPYGALTDDEREKDKEAVLHYPEIVKMAGFKICVMK